MSVASPDATATDTSAVATREPHAEGWRVAIARAFGRLAAATHDLGLAGSP